ncbi:MAG: hypothetical protein ACC656_15205, partial [Candidatus Heimdallarchaeota archaeon]
GLNVKTIEVTVDGINAGTYQDLLDKINEQILLVDNPPQSPIPPISGAFFWNAVEEQLYQYDGVNYNPIDSLNEPADPADVTMGTYWYDTTNKVLNRYNIPNPNGWNIITHFESETDPANPDCESYWFDNTLALKWNGSTWCNQDTIISLTDPSDCPTVECGTYWYNETLSELSSWSMTNEKWESATAIYWQEAPNQLLTGTYWFDDVTNKLFQLVGNTWNDITSTTKIQETEPTTLVDGLLWYKPTTEELKEYSAISPVGFALVPVLVWSEDPTNITSCDLWWDSVSDNLFTWDVVNNEWDQVVRFVQSTLDPTHPAPIAVDAVWYQPVTDINEVFTSGFFED